MLEFYPCFPINEQLDQTDFYTFKNGFDETQIESILKIAEDYEFKDAVVSVSNSLDKEKRKSKIKWLPPEAEKTEWIYEMIMQWVMAANFNLWKFDINHFKDSIQYTEYHDDNGHYDWHMDLGPYPFSTRKISITVQLSDPSEYEGGDFQIRYGNQEITLPKEKGTILLFPSYMLHRVTPVTKGVRKSLVLWVGGTTFR